jgi:hypothetical protein
MDNPCNDCFRHGECDHFDRCIRWRAWFKIQWRDIKTAYAAPAVPRYYWELRLMDRDSSPLLQ